jgi:hypothetical protein
MLTFARQGDPTVAGGAGTPPKHLSLGDEGKADVRDGNQDYIVAELNGRVSASEHYSSELFARTQLISIPLLDRHCCSNRKVRASCRSGGGSQSVLFGDYCSVLPGGLAEVDVSGVSKTIKGEAADLWYQLVKSSSVRSNTTMQ